ncbi:MAG: TadE-like protein [Actinomycetota bacterium]
MIHRRPATGTPRRRPDDGVAAVEFALVLPILVVLLFTLVFGGSVYFDQLHLQSTARDAARVGSVSSSTACSTALAELSGNQMGTVGCSVVTNCTTGTFKVLLTAHQNLDIPILGSRAVTLNASSSYACS